MIGQTYLANLLQVESGMEGILDSISISAIIQYARGPNGAFRGLQGQQGYSVIGIKDVLKRHYGAKRGSKKAKRQEH